jgi:putative exosortase-associated protein (TIGR04073 family)
MWCRPFVKLGRGVVNTVTGVLELPFQIYRSGARDGWVAGLFIGSFNGTGMMLARTLGGAYEILTFPVPVPPQYQPMFQPEFLWSAEPDTPSKYHEQLPGE